jgi:uncharacterized protein
MVSRIITGALLLGLAIGLGGCGSSSTPTGQGVSQPDVPVQVHRRWGYIPTTGGAELRWTLFTPDEAGSYPILVEYDGYAAGSGQVYSDVDFWLRRGYGVLGLSVPGSACSTGEFLVFHPSWGKAGAEAIEWIARQPWSDGNVGMTGLSFSGYMQIWTAAFAPPALKAIAPALNTTDPYRDVAYPGGIFNSGFPALWWAGFPNTWNNFAAPAARDIDGDDRCTQTAAENSIRMNAPQYNMPSQLASHPFYDELYKERSARLLADRITVPVFGAEAWQDEQVGSRNGYYEQVVDPDRLWLLGIPGEHTGMLSLPIAEQMRLQFFDRYLKGIANDWERVPRVTVLNEMTRDENNELQPAFITASSRYPVPVTTVRFHLHPDGSLRESTAGSGTRTYLYPVPGPVVNNPIGTRGEEWQAPVPPGGALVFTTPPLDEVLSLYGPASADLWLSSTAVDTDVQVTITEVRPDGQEMYVQRGWLRASHATLDEALTTERRPWNRHDAGSQSLMTPSVPRLLRIEINKFAHSFRAGSRLRMIIDAPSRTGYWDFARIDIPATNTLHMGADLASVLVVGQWDVAAQVPSELPRCGSLRFQPCRPDPYGE